MDMHDLEATDPDIADLIRREEQRQFTGIELIASENYVSAAVAETMSCVMVNKYAEGLPGKRYYGGCEVVDEAERLAIERAKQLFGADHANVQPHSGAQANAAAYLALIQLGDTVLGMDLKQGGHLTHGAKVNFSGKFYNFVAYGVSPDTETIDYDEVERLAQEHRPKLIVAGFSAYSRKLDFARFRQIADSVGALLMADIAHVAGLVAVGLYPNPIPYCHVVTTTTHKTLRGPRGALILSTAEWGAKIDKAVFPGTQGGPLMHIIAAKAVAFKEALSPAFKTYQQQVVDNAQTLATSLQEHGLRLVSGGTDNHLMLVDTRPLHVNGKRPKMRWRRCISPSTKMASPSTQSHPCAPAASGLARQRSRRAASARTKCAKWPISSLKPSRSATTQAQFSRRRSAPLPWRPPSHCLAS